MGDEWGAAADALSALDWWQLAGLDTLVDDAPRDWLRPIAGRAAQPGAQSAAAPAAAPAAIAPIPDEFTGFRAWLATSDAVPLAGPPAARILPAGDPQAPLAILVDMPEAEDAEAGTLLAGAAGRLLDRMLAAIGQNRAGCYLASVALCRAPAGRLNAAAIEALAPVARRHAALLRPQRLLVLGDEACRALLGAPMAASRGRLHDLNHGDRTVHAIASFHPRFLLGHPALKAEAWRDLQLLHEGLRPS